MSCSNETGVICSWISNTPTSQSYFTFLIEGLIIVISIAIISYMIIDIVKNYKLNKEINKGK